MKNLLWHYIVGPQFQLIANSGVLLPDSSVTGGHLAAVWFGRDDFWEKRAGNISSDRLTDAVYQSNRAEIAERARGLGRIGVLPETAPHSRHDCDEMLRETAPATTVIYRSPMICSRYQWFSIKPVTIEDWQAVEVWQDGTWVSVPFKKMTPSVAL